MTRSTGPDVIHPELLQHGIYEAGLYESPEQATTTITSSTSICSPTGEGHKSKYCGLWFWTSSLETPQTTSLHDRVYWWYHHHSTGQIFDYNQSVRNVIHNSVTVLLDCYPLIVWLISCVYQCLNIGISISNALKATDDCRNYLRTLL